MGAVSKAQTMMDPRAVAHRLVLQLECAVRHLSKPSAKVNEFSKEFWGSQVDTYHGGFQGKNGVMETRWKELVEACLGHLEDSDDETLDANLSILHNDCAHIFNFCSPVKSRA